MRFAFLFIFTVGCTSNGFTPPEKIRACEAQCMRAPAYGEIEECQNICYLMDASW